MKLQYHIPFTRYCILRMKRALEIIRIWDQFIGEIQFNLNSTSTPKYFGTGSLILSSGSFTQKADIQVLWLDSPHRLPQRSPGSLLFWYNFSKGLCLAFISSEFFWASAKFQEMTLPYRISPNYTFFFFEINWAYPCPVLQILMSLSCSAFLLKSIPILFISALLSV